MLIKPHESEGGIHIDFVPMVDILFNLLVFFLLATSIKQAEREMQVALPVASSGAPISAMVKELIINVDAQGRMIIDGAPVDDPRLQQLLDSAVAVNPDQKVTIRGDKATPYAQIAHVLDLCKAAKVQEPYLDTVLAE
jgi:biopolymer transport protein ExbD